MTPKFVFENLVKYIAKDSVTDVIKPVFKSDDFCLYQEDCLWVMAELSKSLNTFTNTNIAA